MRQTDPMLIKDPYLSKTFLSEVPLPATHSPFPRQPETRQYPGDAKWKIQHEMRKELQKTQNQYQRMARAYTEQNMLNRKILDYQAVNNEYHEALKLRNLDLNNKLSDLSTQNHLIVNRFEGDVMRTHQQKDILIRKYEQQAEQLLQAKKTINNLVEHKAKLEEQVQHLTFLLEKEADRFALQAREQAIRMEGLERTMKNVTETKDQEIQQLRHRIRVYEDENKRLNDENRSLNVVNASQREREREKENKGGIENLSQINYMDSQTKEVRDLEARNLNKQLEEQRGINQRLQREIENLKKNLFKKQTEPNQQRAKSKESHHEKQQTKEEIQKQSIKPQGLIHSIETLRNGINKQIFEVFYKSVKDGQKHKSNSLVIFIENWKHLDLQRMQPYINSYIQSRNSLKQLCLSQKYAGKPINQHMEQTIPLHIALRKGRNQINTWILSTIQHTKNQRESGKKSMNNLLLFLFRLLTIQYRITYPMQGKSYTIDTDVCNQLHHEIVKAVNYILDFQ